MRDQSYVSLDLELNGPDVIEIGITVGSPFQSESDWIRQGWYISPASGTPVSQRITELTGISTELLRREGLSLAKAAEGLRPLLAGTFVNPVQWGLQDAPLLLDAFRSEGVQFPHWGRRVIDVKHLFLYIEAANGRTMSGGLRSALGRHKLQFVGTPHNAVDDSYNTLRLFFHLLRRQQALEQARVQLSQLP